MIILFAACFAFYMIEIVRWQYLWKKTLDIKSDESLMVSYPLNRKPFNCITCLSGWVGGLTALACGEGWNCIMFVFVSAVAGIFLERILKS
jgi:hypothetical protein